MDNFELEEIHLDNIERFPDPRPMYSEESIHMEDAKTISPEKLKQLEHVDFPGLGPCIAAVVFGETSQDIFALHITPHEKPELIQQKVSNFLMSHPDQNNWKLEYTVRRNQPPARPMQGNDTVEGNKANLNFLADLCETFPDQIKHVKVIYIDTPNGVDTFAWNHEKHFFAFSPSAKNFS